MKKNSFDQYDVDTALGTSNFYPGKYAVNVGKKEYMGYIYDDFVKHPDRGFGYYTYDFVLVNNGKIIAMGDEQLRCGGITSTCKEADFAEKVKLSPAYEKVKHLPVASPEELEEPVYRFFKSYKEYEDLVNKQNQ